MREKLTLKQIGEKLGISPQRIHQICNPIKKKFCEKHLSSYAKECLFCYIDDKYSKLVSSNYLNEAVRLQEHDRTAKTVLERIQLIKYLHDTKDMPFAKIGKLLRRDHSTISYLYKK